MIKTLPFMLLASFFWFTVISMEADKSPANLFEGFSLAKEAIYHATHRDAYSGGINNLHQVTKYNLYSCSVH